MSALHWSELSNTSWYPEPFRVWPQRHHGAVAQMHHWGVSSTCPLVAMFRGTGLLAKSIKMEHILSLGMKYVCAAQKISNSFVHRGTLKAFSAENHSRAEGYLDAVLLCYGRSQFQHHHSHMLLLNDPAALPHCLYLLTIEKYLHEKYSKRREVNKTVIWAENIKQRFSSLHEVIDF